MRLIVSLGLTAYPTLAVDFTLLIQQATCNCNLVTWDQPAIVTLDTKLMKAPVETITLTKASVNTASTQAEPAIRSCTGANACDYTATVVLVDGNTSALDGAFMTFDTSTLVLTVEPTVSS
jgi:hypothetical protein